MVSCCANNHIEQLMKYEPQMPDKLRPSKRLLLGTLLSIAELLGDEIAQEARNAAIEVCKINFKTNLVNELMLFDIRRVFGSRK
jgi:hypothetical protein